MEVPVRVNSEKPWCSTTLGTQSTFLGGYDPPVGGKRKHPYKPMMSCQSSMIISLCSLHSVSISGTLVVVVDVLTCGGFNPS